MRVALVAMETTHYRDTDGARRFERLARLLSDRGHDVTILCAQWWDGHPDTWEADGIRYRAVTLGPNPRSFAAKLPFTLARHRPDVIHARPRPPQAVVTATIGGFLARAPVAVEWFGDETLPTDSAWTRRAAHAPAAIVTPSEFVRTAVRERGASADTVRVIPESIDFDAIETVDPAEEIDVAYAHSLDETANLESMLLGLAELRNRDWSATIVGEGPKREAYEAQAADLRIDDRIDFVGGCDRNQRLAIYRGAHAFVQTATKEYFATELLWALACGCVGIVEYQADSSAHELIENYSRSYRTTNPQQLADAIVDAGEFDHQTIDDTWSEYDHTPITSQYVDVYRNLTKEYGWFD